MKCEAQRYWLFPPLLRTTWTYGNALALMQKFGFDDLIEADKRYHREGE
jgi:hypothetical protein